jgi:DNA-binding HxlR family transcriptional regulator
MDRLKELVGSDARARVLAHFVTHPESAIHMRALERRIGVPSRSLQLELERLERLGLL